MLAAAVAEMATTGLAHVPPAVSSVVEAMPAQPPPPPGGGGGFDFSGGGVQAPPGSEQLYTILGYARWAALIACVAGFFMGIVAFTVGRVTDNRRGQGVGVSMLAAAMGGALLFGIGPLLLESFAAAGGAG